ncbi:MAG: SDR family oxidoreductase [Ktedonobacteraceae bacterium]|nr:SDR family oxidoreductase [Ktedonobacteraceae bacterium]
MHAEQKEAQTYQDKVIIVTGGGSGIGRTVAQQFAALGGSVLIAGRHADALEQTIERSSAMACIVADLSCEEEAIAVIEWAEALWGRIDVLVNNAATGALTPLETVTTEQLSSIFTLNVFAPIWLSKAALSALTQSRGTILNISSTYGHKAGAGMTYYAVSKAALEHWTRCLALELAPRGIRVNAIAPGPTATGGLERVGLPAEVIEEIKRRDLAKIPLGRRGVPDEVADWIVALAAPSASWITGQVLSVDGGMSLS